MTKYQNNEKIDMKSLGVDWWTVFIYLLLVLFGWLNIYSAVYADDNRSIFDMTQIYGKQMLWIGVSITVALAILLIDDKYYHMLAFPFFGFMLALMIFVAFFGDVTNGSKSWLSLGGGVKIQPVEFMKIATALALARLISSAHFEITDRTSVYYIGLIIFLPVMVILLQNDTGSALVFFAFFLMLYREGFGKELYILLGFMIMLSVLSFLLEPLALLLVTSFFCFGASILSTRNWGGAIRYLAIVILLFVSLIWFTTPYLSLLISIGITIPFLLVRALRTGNKVVVVIIVVFIGAILLNFVVDYTFDNVLQIHQKERILDLLGIESNPQGSSYNVIQSKVAIGSGGLTGKGFLNGTQTRFSFVPEQATDFIFCTVGEEWGFVGSIGVVILFGLLLVRLIFMGERQQEPFARAYCYSVAAIILMHFLINISMTIGLFPVCGIPLPFFSYGGSSLLAFTVLVFIAIRLDSKQPSSKEGLWL